MGMDPNVESTGGDLLLGGSGTEFDAKLLIVVFFLGPVSLHTLIYSFIYQCHY